MPNPIISCASCFATKETQRQYERAVSFNAFRKTYNDWPSAVRPLKTVTHEVDPTVLGGGLAGTCAAIAAAWEGLECTFYRSPDNCNVCVL